MAFDYAGARDTVAQPLIDEFGKPGTVMVNDPSTSVGPGESQLGNETPHAVRLVQAQFKKADNSGTLVETGDVLYLVSTQGVAIDPALANRMVVDGTTYEVIRVDPLQPGDTVMLWKIHARK